MKKTLTALALTVFALRLCSAESVTTWTGEAGDGNFYTPGNWDKGAPGRTTTVRFVSDACLTASGSPTVSEGYGGKWKLEEGVQVYFAKESLHYIGNSGTVVVDVAKDALLVVSNGFSGYNPAIFRKEGEGTLRLHGKLNSNNNNGKGWHTFDVVGGRMEFVLLPSASVGTDITNIVVRSGAELCYRGKPSWHSDKIALCLERGSTLRLVDFGNNNKIAALSGEGEIVAEGDTASHICCEMTKPCDNPFTGSLSGNLVLEYCASIEKHPSVQLFPDAEIRLSGVEEEVISVPVKGEGTLAVHNGKKTFGSFYPENCKKLVHYSPIELSGGEGTIGTVCAGKKNALCTISGGRFTGGESLGTTGQGHLGTPDGINTTASITFGHLEVTGGEFAWAGGNGVSEFRMRGGRTWFMKSNAFALDTLQWVFDGGEAVIDCKNSPISSFVFPRPNQASTNWIGAAGGRLRAVNCNHSISMSGYNGVWTNATTNGKLEFYGDAEWIFARQWNLNGPVFMKDGVAAIAAGAATADNPWPFGTGEFCLGNAVLNFYWDWQGKTPPVVNFGSLAYAGASTVRFRSHDNTESGSFPAQNVVVGSLRRAGKGAVLFLRENDSASDASLGRDGYSTFKVETGLANCDGGFLREPIVVAGVIASNFARLDADRGIVAVPDEDYALNSFENLGPGRLLRLTGSFSPPAGDVRVAGVKQCDSYNSTVTIGDNSTLHIGDGVNPAMYFFYVNTSVKGQGTIDFGASEGIFVVATATQDTHANEIGCRISGSGGITYAAYRYDSSHRKILRLSAASDYTGGTWINGCMVVPLVAGAFSSGVVTVGEGESRGGRVLLSEPIELANDFVVGGSGSGNGENTSGCVVFDAPAVLSGAMKIGEDARIGVSRGVVGTVSGKVSGGRLVACGGGTLRLSGDNVHCGGSEALDSTICVPSCSALGTGEVVLNGGVLRLENMAAETMDNSLRGIGSVQMAGAEVKFRGNTRRLDAASVLDIPGTEITLSEQPPFANITNSVRKTAKVTLSGADYSFDPGKWGGRFALELEDGARLDLGGGTLCVRSFTGDRSAVNGKIVQDLPGVMIIVR